MKLNHIILIAAIAAGSVLVGCGNDQSNEPSFDSQLYIKAESMTEKIALKGRLSETLRSLSLAVPKPATGDINITCNTDESLVNVYNRSFYDQAVMLPNEYYELTKTNAVLRKGTVLSDNIDIQFKNLETLPRTEVYVLPVTIINADNISVLQSRRTYYYVLKSSAMIEVVPDMELKNCVRIATFAENQPAGEVCNNLSQFTMEALIRVHDFPKGIQSIMGMEAYVLLRISDNGLAPNQLQVVTPEGNFSDNVKCLLEANKWTHIALTYDIAAKSYVLYIDGVEASRRDLVNPTPVNLGKTFKNGDKTYSFRLGYSYASGRELNGQLSECRIWNVVRTPEQLRDNVYEVEPKSPGLVAYWKLNEGRGKNIKDYTDNGNDGVGYNEMTQSEAMLKWTPVFLPEIVE